MIYHLCSEGRKAKKKLRHKSPISSSFLISSDAIVRPSRISNHTKRNMTYVIDAWGPQTHQPDFLPLLSISFPSRLAFTACTAPPPSLILTQVRSSVVVVRPFPLLSHAQKRSHVDDVGVIINKLTNCPTEFKEE